MGCDIHMQVERRVDGEWKRVEKLPPRACSWCDGRGHYEKHPLDKCYWCGEKNGGENTPGIDTKPFHDRNYTVFSVLANVRNDGYVTPICEPRGLPEGHSEEGIDKDGEKDWPFGDHSFSWLTLAELQGYDWKRVIKDEGLVDAPTFAAWDKNGATGRPKEWCGGVGGAAVEHVTHSRMREYIAEGMKEDALIERIAGKRSFYTLIQWESSLADYCKTFLAFMESLSAIGAAPDDVRIVFGFDS